MGKVMPYQGTYASARSASELLDLDAILAGCNAVDEKALKMSTYSGDIKSATSTLDESSFSIEKETPQPKIEEACTGVKSLESAILETTASIRAASESAYNSIQEQLNYEAQQKDQYLRSQNNNK